MVQNCSWQFTEQNGKSGGVHTYTVVQTGAESGKLHCVLQDHLKEHNRLDLSSWMLNWLKEAFLPRGFPESVSPDYIHYQCWDTLQAYCSSVAGAVSLHATLGSLGVGKEGSTALAATLTWLTNTGAGMVASIAFTYCKGTQLDSNNKQWRLFADVANDAGHLVKLATPLLPLPPLLPLSFAAVLYALVGVAGGATRTALTAHQARASNLADVSAKDGSQETLVNLAALLTSLILLPLVTHNLRLTWSVFLVLLVVHLYCNYRAVRAVVAPSLNRPRLLVVFRHFAATRHVPTVTEANYQEPLWAGPAFNTRYLDGGWSLEVGYSLRDALLHSDPHASQPVLADNFLVVMNERRRRVWVAVCDGVGQREVLLAYWTAFLIARSHQTATQGSSGATLRDLLPEEAEHRDVTLNRVREKARDSFPLIWDQLHAQGWDTERLFLDTGDWRLQELPSATSRCPQTIGATMKLVTPVQSLL